MKRGLFQKELELPRTFPAPLLLLSIICSHLVSAPAIIQLYGASVFQCCAQAPDLDELTPQRMMSDKNLFEDMWADASALDVVFYLRGGIGLQLPKEWRKAL